MNQRNMQSKLAYLLFSILVLIIDQATKVWATRSLKPIIVHEVIPGFFRLVYATNRGVAFSMFADGEFDARWIFATISILAAVFVLFYLFRISPGKIRLGISLSLLLAGIVGNLIDRVRLGEVIDFLGFHWQDKYSWPIFNLADTAICIGAGLLALDMLLEEKSGEPKAGESSAVTEEDSINASQIEG